MEFMAAVIDSSSELKLVVVEKSISSVDVFGAFIELMLSGGLSLSLVCRHSNVGSCVG